MIGRTIGNYRVAEKLGEGGMGAVYRAVDQMVERNVAIKVLKPEVASNPGTYERFLTEARALAKLNHPAIAMLYSFFREGDEYFMVMEYVHGQTLEKLIRTHGAIRWPQAAATLVRILEGVGHAHSHGIVHRDLKPANIMLSYTGDVKITDFGIARVFYTPRLTRESRVVGTMEYLAPERALGKEADARTDIYSLGIILYEMLTGRLPFEGGSDYELIRAQVEQPPKPLHELGVTVPPLIDAALMTALAKDPAQRHHDAAAFAAQLRAAMEEPASPVLSPEAKETVLAPVAKETVLAPVAKETVLAPVAKETVLAPVAKQTVLAPVAKETVLASVSPTKPALPPLGLRAAIAGVILAILVAGFFWQRASRRQAELTSIHPAMTAASNSVAANSGPVPLPQPSPVTTAPDPVPPEPTPLPPVDNTAKPAPRPRNPRTAPPEPAPLPPVDNSISAPITPVPDTTPPEPTPVPVPDTNATKPDEGVPPAPSVRRLGDVRTIYLKPMPENLDAHLRQEIGSELRGRLRVAASAASADAVMNVVIEDEHGNRIVGATGRLIGVKGAKRAVVTLSDRTGQHQLWTATVDDRHNLVTSLRDDMKRLASRIAKRLHNDMR